MGLEGKRGCQVALHPNSSPVCVGFVGGCCTPSALHASPYAVTYFKKRVGARFDDGARSLAIIHPGIVRRSTGEPWRGPDGCWIRLHDDHTAPDPVSKSEKARL